MNLPRFALLSHVLPPSPSGQSAMLYRIFSGFDPEDYYLVSREVYEKKDEGNDFLLGKYFYIPSPRIFYLINKFKMPQSLRDMTSFLILVLWRAYKLVRLMLKNPVKFVIACSGDIADIPAGYLASRVLGVKFYAYLFDDYVYQWIGFQRSIAKFMAPQIFGNSTGIIGPNEYICEEYQRRYNNKYVVVRNPYRLDEFGVQVGAPWPLDVRRIRIVYTGAVYHANYDCFRNLLQSMDMISDYNLELHIYTAQTIEQLNSQGIGGAKVCIHSHELNTVILEEQRQADILFLPLAFESPIPEVLRTSAPGKMGEYFASGRPVLAHVPSNSFVAYYLKKYQCGMVADKNLPENLAECILELIRDSILRSAIVINAHKRAQADFDPRISQKILKDFLLSSMEFSG